MSDPYGEKLKNMAPRQPRNSAPLKDGDKDWQTKCMCCEQTPTVHPLQLCGPCCFGEGATAGGNW